MRHADSRAALNRHYVDEIARATGLPIVELPFLDGGVNGPDDLAVLGAALVPEASS